MFKIFVFMGWTTLSLAGTTSDKHDKINGVVLDSGKDDSVRTYKGLVNKTFSYPVETVLKSVLNFNEKCNNSYKNKREFTDKALDCKYHNDNLVESVLIRELKTGWTKETNEVDRFLIGRKIYNRGNFNHYDLIKVFHTTNDLNQKVVTIHQRMLSTDESKQYVEPKFEKDSAFDDTVAIFTLVQTKPTETTFTYEYIASTDHWILNKEVSVPQVFSSISKSINDLVKTVDAETALQSRDVASF